MKTTWFGLSLALIAATAFAAEYRSSFGFPFVLSNDWLVLTPKDVSKQYEGETLESLRLEFGDTENMKAVLQRVKAGNVEFYFDKKYSTKTFTNNISVQLMPGTQSPTAQDVKTFCATLPNELQSTYGDGVSVKDCKLSESNEVRYIAYEYFIARENVTIVQNEIPYISNTTLVLVGGSNTTGLSALKSTQGSIALSITKYVNEKSETKAKTSISAGKLPGEQGHIALVKESMRMFSLSVNAKNFSEFHKSISRLWQREVTVSRLNQAFKPFMDNNINLLPLDNITPVFDVTPSVDDRGVLTIKGYYPTKPSRVTFEFGYVYEGASWKLARTKVNIKATQ